MSRRGEPHPQRIGKSAARVAAEDQARRSAENERIAREQEQVEADDVARHPGEADYK